MEIAVLGPTSFVGRALLPALMHRGHRLRLLTRDARRIPDFWRHHHVCVFGALTHPHALHEVLDGAERVVVTLHMGLRKPRAGVDDPEVSAARELAIQLQRASCGPLLRVSTDLPEPGSNPAWAIEARRRADRLLLESPHPVRIVRAGPLIDWFGLLVLGRTLFHPAWPNRPLGWLRLRDLVEAVCDDLEGCTPGEVSVRGRTRLSPDEAAARWIASGAARTQLVRLPAKTQRRLFRLMPAWSFLCGWIEAMAAAPPALLKPERTVGPADAFEGIQAGLAGPSDN